MDALKRMYERLNFDNIKTYVQSGNVVFSAKNEDTNELQRMISAAIQTEFGFDVPAIVMNTETLRSIIANNPFTQDNQIDTAFLHVTFLAETPLEMDEESILAKKHPAEQIALAPNAVYLYCPNGYGRTKLNNNFLEKKLKVQATTRNWKTTIELLHLASTQ